jgi:hypothetical protein
VKESSISGVRQHAAQMHALAAVRREIGSRDRASRSKYLREFTAAFRKYDAPLTREQLNAQLTSADLILLGDYHALPACQKFAAEIIEQFAGGRPIVVGAEAMLSRDQQILDSWWRGEIGEQELRERLRFDREWGYDWTPFYDLLTAARQHADGIYGLDCVPRTDLRRIRSRDRHATLKIREMREQHPEATLLVIFGESHMSPEHLPALVKEALPRERTVTVLQNVDALYWQAVGEEAEAVSLGPDAVCVFNSNPLEKYESYRLCLERWTGDDQPDFSPAVYNLIFSLARCLGFRLDSPNNGTQPKYLADSLPEVVYVSEPDAQDHLPEKEKAAFEHLGCVYAPRTNTFFIREFKMAHAAGEAARFLHHACKGMPREPGQNDLENALAHFGSRLLCPGNLEQASAHAEGETLYRAYLEGRVTRAAVRRMFLART